MSLKKKKVVIVNQNSGYLVIDIANAFSLKYAQVVLICGLLRKMERDLAPDIYIQKIIRYNRNSTTNRLWTWLVGSVQIFFTLLFKYRSYEVVYFTNPPFAYLFSILLPNKFSVVVYDAYPDALKIVGIGDRNLLYNFWARLNKIVFRKAVKIITLSAGMADLVQKYSAKEKIRVIPNWSGSDYFRQIPKAENTFAIKHLLLEKFVVMYSGNMGYTHNLEILIHLASALKDNKEIVFLMIGEGQKKPLLEDMAVRLKLENLLFLGWQSPEDLPYSLASADIAVVTLDADASQLSVPSKTYNILATGTPVLCFAPESSELCRLIRTFNFGKYFSGENIDEIKDFILLLKSSANEKRKYSDNALAASKTFTKENATQYL